MPPATRTGTLNPKNHASDDVGPVGGAGASDVFGEYAGWMFAKTGAGMPSIVWFDKGEGS